MEMLATTSSRYRGETTEMPATTSSDVALAAMMEMPETTSSDVALAAMMEMPETIKVHMQPRICTASIRSHDDST